MTVNWKVLLSESLRQHLLQKVEEEKFLRFYLQQMSERDQIQVPDRTGSSLHSLFGFREYINLKLTYRFII